MSTCSRCGRDVVRVTHGAMTRDLDPTPMTYVTAHERHIFPEDGDAVVLSAALVEHAVVCPKMREEEARQRQQYRARKERERQEA